MNIGSTSYLPEPLPLLSGSALKIIAVVSMVIDHYAYYLMDGNTMAYEVMRCFGRIAFPVFAFLVAEGFAHTRNRMRYFLSLMLFAVVSEVPWYLLNGADGTHNVMFTLALGVAALGSGGFGRFREASETRGFGNCRNLACRIVGGNFRLRLWVARYRRDTRVPPL